MSKNSRLKILNITQQNCTNEVSLIRNLVSMCGGYVPEKCFNTLFSYLSDDSMNVLKWRMKRAGLEFVDGYIKHAAIDTFSEAHFNVGLALIAITEQLDNVTNIFKIENTPPYIFMISTDKAFYKVAVMYEGNKRIINTIMEYDKDNERLEEKYRPQKIVVFQAKYANEYFEILNSRNDPSLKLCVTIDDEQNVEFYYRDELDEDSNDVEKVNNLFDEIDENELIKGANQIAKRMKKSSIADGDPYDS